MTANGRIPMDLTDPYYGQFWPNGVVGVESSKKWGYNETPFGSLGTFRRKSTVTLTGNPVQPRIPATVMAEACRNYRVRHGLTQRELAKMLGGTDMKISGIENARYENTLLCTVRRWAASLGLTVDEFLAYADES